jgi:long-chain fatty acid transport protein
VILLAVTLAPARAASLDLLEVGGPYGTPGATNPSALWWNPAGLAVAGGKLQLLVDVAPTIGSVTAQRDNPDYGALTAQPGFPTTYDYSGTDRLKFVGVVPFLGASSNLGVKGLGVGLGFAVPTGRGGESDQEWGSNRFAIRDGNVNATHLIAGAGYQWKDKIAVGASVHLVHSSWYANSDISAYPDLRNAFADLHPELGTETFQDGFIEDRHYSSTAILGGAKDGGGHGALTDTTATFGLGLYLTPIRQLGVSVGYVHGESLTNEGDATLTFQCPPDYDSNALGVAEEGGFCHDGKPTTVNGTATVAYHLPSRINVGVVLTPIERVRIEAMSAYVFWSSFDAYTITPNVLPTEFAFLNDNTKASVSAEQINVERTWARDNQNTFWVGLDGKVRLPGPLTVGARGVYDHHAIPDSALLANNIDNDDLTLGLLAEIDPIPNLGLALSVDHHFLTTRTITDSAFRMTLDDANAPDPAYFYPSGNGTYSGSITRLGLSIRGHFGGSRW